MARQITSDNIDISPSMTALAEEKLSRFENRLTEVPEDLKDIRVVLNTGAEEGSFTVKIEVSLGKFVFISEETDYSLESALIRAVEDVERQYKKMKSKGESEEWEFKRELKRFPLEDEQ